MSQKYKENLSCSSDEISSGVDRNASERLAELKND
jgi:hypothetical protein